MKLFEEAEQLGFHLFEVKLGLERVPDTEVGSTIVNDDGSGGTEAIVIGLTLNFRDERHCRVKQKKKKKKKERSLLSVSCESRSCRWW